MIGPDIKTMMNLISQRREQMKENGKDATTANANEVYFIAQSKDRPYEDLREEERRIVEKLGITLVDFTHAEGHGIYKLRDDAIAVGQLLSSAKPSRKLAVIAQIVSNETPPPYRGAY